MNGQQNAFDRLANPAGKNSLAPVKTQIRLQEVSRKKSRCPGEKPVCSHCARLGQNCYYAEEPHRSDGLTPARRQVSPPANTTTPLVS